MEEEPYRLLRGRHTVAAPPLIRAELSELDGGLGAAHFHIIGNGQAVKEWSQALEKSFWEPIPPICGTHLFPISQNVIRYFCFASPGAREGRRARGPHDRRELLQLQGRGCACGCRHHRQGTHPERFVICHMSPWRGNRNAKWYSPRNSTVAVIY